MDKRKHYCDVNSNYYDEKSNYWCIDVWDSDDPNAEGSTAAVVNGTTGDVWYIDPVARFDSVVQEHIDNIKHRIKTILPE